MAEILPIRLGVNVDHVATLRNARGGKHPDPLRAAKAAIAAGADGITVHLREDRRHIRDDDVRRLKAEVSAPLNFELAATEEMVAIALDVRPHAACIVPEKRTERTTEGGLEVAGARQMLTPAVSKLRGAGIRVSLFIEPDPHQIEAAAAVEAPVIEIHTGAWCEAIAQGDAAAAEAIFERVREGARLAVKLGLEVHAGHGLDFATAETISALPEVVELNIGHFLVGEALFSGFDSVIRTFRAAMDRGACEGEEPGRMIIGMGSDITDIRRIEKVIGRHGERFLERIFTDAERARAERRANRIATYAKRFAAKEACAKALGTGIRRGVWWRDMGVVNLPSGRPTFELTGGALRRLQEITPPGYEAQIDLTISDEWPLAQAVVVISVVQKTGG